MMPPPSFEDSCLSGILQGAGPTDARAVNPRQTWPPTHAPPIATPKRTLALAQGITHVCSSSGIASTVTENRQARPPRPGHAQKQHARTKKAPARAGRRPAGRGAAARRRARAQRARTPPGGAAGTRQSPGREDDQRPEAQGAPRPRGRSSHPARPGPPAARRARLRRINGCARPRADAARGAGGRAGGGGSGGAGAPRRRESFGMERAPEDARSTWVRDLAAPRRAPRLLG
ncbi:MAG: hypothetical protein J3K34DRAFT_135124 [Monoraphidium minutum]|nr:MAG: hypothetical protein J3K34DRAFT_135124 [Monoraphidium minutum]